MQSDHPSPPPSCIYIRPRTINLLSLIIAAIQMSSFIMHASCVVAAAALTLATASSVEPTRALRDVPRPTEIGLQARQDGGDSVCSVFGVDFQGGGSYFINSNSNDNFTLVAEFEGCECSSTHKRLIRWALTKPRSE